MKLEDQVVSLELAKKLKELGVKQESYFCWDIRDEKILDSSICMNDEIPAFTVAELGEMLWEAIKNDYSQSQYLGKAYLQAFSKEFDDYKSEADARAKLLIHLIEQGIIKTDEDK